jgi:hypothetical protein
MFFFNKNDNRISNFWRLPSFKEIAELEIDYDTYK